jgi:hypothetical protein
MPADRPASQRGDRFIYRGFATCRADALSSPGHIRCLSKIRMKGAHWRAFPPELTVILNCIPRAYSQKKSWSARRYAEYDRQPLRGSQIASTSRTTPASWRKKTFKSLHAVDLRVPGEAACSCCWVPTGRVNRLRTLIMCRLTCVAGAARVRCMKIIIHAAYDTDSGQLFEADEDDVSMLP